jgi:hypothetical protein
VTYIGSDAFATYGSNLSVTGVDGSYAQEYFYKNGIAFSPPYTVVSETTSSTSSTSESTSISIEPSSITTE